MTAYKDWKRRHRREFWTAFAVAFCWFVVGVMLIGAMMWAVMLGK